MKLSQKCLPNKKRKKNSRSLREKGSIRSLLRTLCTVLGLALSSRDQSNLKWNWMSSGSLQIIRRLLSLARGKQSGITFFCEDKFSELQISVVGELSSVISLIFDEMCGEFTFSWNFGSWFRIMKARYKDVPQKIWFLRVGVYSTH